MKRNAKRTWDRLIELLVAVRLGQELGTDSEIAQAVAGTLDWLIRAVSQFLG